MTRHFNFKVQFFAEFTNQALNGSFANLKSSARKLGDPVLLDKFIGNQHRVFVNQNPINPYIEPPGHMVKIKLKGESGKKSP